MPFELFIALRYLRAKRKGIFAFVTTSIGVAGVTVGVAALITTLSVMNGFQTDIQKKIIGAQAHLTVYGPKAAELEKKRIFEVQKLLQNSVPRNLDDDDVDDVVGPEVPK